MRDQKTSSVVTGKTITLNGTTILRDEFPLGQGWYTLDLVFNMLLDINSSTGAITEGELNIIKNIQLKTDIDGLCYNLPGRAIYRINQILNGTAPAKNSIAAADGTYRVHLPLYFALPNLVRPEDTILDTARYRNIELYITYGGVADLFTSVNADTVLTVTLDVNIKHTEGIILDGGGPIVYPYFGYNPPINPSSQTYIDLEKNPELALAMAFLFSGNSVTAGVPFHGTANDSVLSALSMETESEFLFRSVKAYHLQFENKGKYQAESWPTGWYVIDFVKDGSIFSAISTGDKAKLQINWVNDTLSTSGVNAAILGLKQLK